jgi:type IV secretory pathway TrbD component
MQRNQMSQESRRSVAVAGIVLTGVVAALVLPIWMAAVCLLVALCVLRTIAGVEPAFEPVVIRRDERR